MCLFFKFSKSDLFLSIENFLIRLHWNSLKNWIYFQQVFFLLCIFFKAARGPCTYAIHVYNFMVYLTSFRRLVWNSTAFFWALSCLLCCVFGQHICALSIIAFCNFYITVNELRFQQSIVKYGQIKIIVPFEYSYLKTPFRKMLFWQSKDLFYCFGWGFFWGGGINCPKVYSYFLKYLILMQLYIIRYNINIILTTYMYISKVKGLGFLLID